MKKYFCSYFGLYQLFLCGNIWHCSWRKWYTIVCPQSTTAIYTVVCVAGLHVLELIHSTFPSARPSMILPEKTVLTEGEEKTIQCDIIGYYPDKLTVTWHIQNGSRTVQAGGSHVFHVCNEMAVHNPDDTYSIRSGIRLNLSAVKKGELRLICQLEHQPDSWTYSRAVALTVQGRIVFFFHC